MLDLIWSMVEGLIGGLSFILHTSIRFPSILFILNLIVLFIGLIIAVFISTLFGKLLFILRINKTELIEKISYWIIATITILFASGLIGNIWMTLMLWPKNVSDNMPNYTTIAKSFLIEFAIAIIMLFLTIKISERIILIFKRK